MKFLTEAKLPLLDPYCSRSTQSTLVEVIFWTFLYLLYASSASRIIRRLFRNLGIWTTARRRGGIFCQNGRDDSVLLLVIGTHHFMAGSLMYLGLVHNDADLWRHGYLLETGFELADVLSALFRLYPYKWDGVKTDLKVAMMFHHMPGLTLCGFVMDTGLYANPHMQAIGMWLLSAAALSCLVGIWIYSLTDEQNVLAAIAFNINIWFFVFCRFYIFPIEALGLLRDVSESDLNGTIVHKLLYFGGICLTLFNVAVASDAVPKTIRYVRRAFDGVTLIDTAPVPPSRDSILGSGRRRSSLLNAVKVLSTATTRSSFAAVALCDVSQSAPVQSLKHSDSSDSLDLSPEDLHALNKTLSSISENSKKKA